MKKSTFILLFLASYNNIFSMQNSYYKKDGESWKRCIEINSKEAECKTVFNDSEVCELLKIAQLFKQVEKQYQKTLEAKNNTDLITTLTTAINSNYIKSLEKNVKKDLLLVLEKIYSISKDLISKDPEIEPNISKEEQEKGSQQFALEVNVFLEALQKILNF